MKKTKKHKLNKVLKIDAIVTFSLLFITILMLIFFIIGVINSFVLCFLSTSIFLVFEDFNHDILPRIKENNKRNKYINKELIKRRKSN